MGKGTIKVYDDIEIAFQYNDFVCTSTAKVVKFIHDLQDWNGVVFNRL